MSVAQSNDTRHVLKTIKSLPLPTAKLTQMQLLFAVFVSIKTEYDSATRFLSPVTLILIQ